MATTASNTPLTLALAASAVGFAAYAWVGPLPFMGEPDAWQPPPSNGPAGPEAPKIIGADRPADFESLGSSLASLRTPEVEDTPPPDPVANITPPVEDTPPPPPLEGWSYIGYIGPPDKLVALLTDPEGGQLWAPVGRTIGAGHTVVRVTDTAVLLERDGEENLLMHISVEDTVAIEEEPALADDAQQPDVRRRAPVARPGAAGGLHKRGTTDAKNTLITPTGRGGDR
jgi:hypothetical protein